MDAESNKHLVKVGDDKNILGILLALLPQVPGQVHHCKHSVPGLEDPLHRRVRMGHGLDRLGNHNLADLGHVNAVEISPDGKLHDLNLIGTGLQKDPAVLRISHFSNAPIS